MQHARPNYLIPSPLSARSPNHQCNPDTMLQKVALCYNSYSGCQASERLLFPNEANYPPSQLKIEPRPPNEPKQTHRPRSRGQGLCWKLFPHPDRLLSSAQVATVTKEMTPISPKPASQPSEIGGYSIIRALSDQSWLAEAAGARRVVLKLLDDDCLWKAQLHPSVKDRLARVRELAHAGVANLYGVERDGVLTYLVWDYVEGISLDEFAASSRCNVRDLLVMARELVLSVEVLHARGIVHGMLKSSNVIIGIDSRPVLTHVSPLLYTNPQQDLATLVGMLGDLLESRGESDSVLGKLLQQAGEEEWPLRKLALRLGALIDARDTDAGDVAEKGSADRIKRRALLGAGATAVLGVALFFGLKQYASARTPKPPVAPQATPAAMQPAPHAENAVATRARP